MASNERGPAEQRVRDRWEQQLRRDPRVVGTALAVLFVMASYGDRDGTRIRVGVSSLVRDCGLSEPTIRRATELGRRLGYVERVRRGHRLGDGQVIASEYVLRLPVSTAHGGAEEDASSARRRAVDLVSTDHQRAVDPVATAHKPDLNRSPERSQPLTSDGLPGTYTRPVHQKEQRARPTPLSTADMRFRDAIAIGEQMQAEQDRRAIG